MELQISAMTRDEICVAAIKAGFDAYISHEHWGDVFAVRKMELRQAEFGGMLMAFARIIEEKTKAYCEKS
tara:strand:- start:748 stop:957 length:210 start_codon:yes stop_codon:yes gene_type:complete